MNDKFSLLKRMLSFRYHSSPNFFTRKVWYWRLRPRSIPFRASSGTASIYATLPLGPTGGHNSPYQCFSSFAGQPLLISPELLKDEGLLTDADLSNVPHFSDEEVDFAAVE